MTGADRTSVISKIATRVTHGAKLLFVRRKALANGWRGWSALAASLVVSAAMLYAQTTKHPPCCVGSPATTTNGPAAAAAPPTAGVPAPAPAGAPAGGPHIATPEEVNALAALAPAVAAAQPFRFPLPRGVASEDRLQVKTIWAARAIGVLFPQITKIFGYREDPLPWHPNGLAIDVMIPNHDSPQGIELGNQIAGYALANAKRWGINHVIWRQKIYPGVGAPSWMSNLGNETLNHYDHVHIATGGGGYPTGHEIYYIDSMTSGPSE